MKRLSVFGDGDAEVSLWELAGDHFGVILTAGSGKELVFARNHRRYEDAALDFTQAVAGELACRTGRDLLDVKLAA